MNNKFKKFGLATVILLAASSQAVAETNEAHFVNSASNLTSTASAVEGVGAKFNYASFGETSANNLVANAAYDFSDEIQVGAIGGYQSFSTKDAKKSGSTNYFGGVFANAKFDNVVANAGVSYAMGTFSNDDAALTAAKDAKTLKVSTSISTIAAQASAGYNFEVANSLNVAPGALVRYTKFSGTAGDFAKDAEFQALNEDQQAAFNSAAMVGESSLAQVGPSVTLSYSVAEKANVSLSAAALYDLSKTEGLFVAKNAAKDATFMDAMSFEGNLSATFNATDEFALSANAGVQYRPNLKADSKTAINIGGMASFDLI